MFIARRHEQHVIHHHHHHHHQHRGSTSNPANVAQHGAGGDESHLLPPPAAAPAARGAVDLDHSPIPPPGFTNCVDSDWLGFFNDNNRVPGAHVDAVEGARAGVLPDDGGHVARTRQRVEAAVARLAALLEAEDRLAPVSRARSLSCFISILPRLAIFVQCANANVRRTTQIHAVLT